MKLKSLAKVILAASAFMTASLAMAGGPDIAPVKDPTQDAIHAYVSASAYFGDDTVIRNGFDNDINAHLQTNLNRQGDDTTFVPELGLWFPLWSNHENMIVNFVTFVNWIPGSKITSRGDAPADHYFTVAIHQHMMNWGIGLNFLRYFAERWFALAMLGGGVNYLDYHGDFESFDPANDVSLYTGTSSIYRPFLTVKLGLGVNVSDKSQVLVFGRYTTVSQRSLFLANVGAGGAGQTAIGVDLGAPDNWWEVGVQFTRAFSL